MDIAPKYEDVVADRDALRKDLEMFVKAQLGISISEPGESFVQTTLRVFRMSKRRAAEFGFPEGENLEADIEALEDYDDLQQRLTVAEQRAGELTGLLKLSLLAVDDVAENCEDQTDWATANSMHALSKRITDALKPAEDYNELDDDEDLEVFDDQ